MISSVDKIPKIPHMDHGAFASTARAAIIHAEAKENLTFLLKDLILSVEEYGENEKDRFFRVVDVLRDAFENAWFQDKENRIHEFIRKMYCGETDDQIPEKEWLNFVDALRFLKTLKSFKKLAYKNLFDVITDRGNDSYGDLVDSIILAGKGVYDKICSKAYCTGEMKRLCEDVKAAVSEKLAKNILEGENYIEMLTTEKIQEFFYPWVRRLGYKHCPTNQEF